MSCRGPFAHFCIYIYIYAYFFFEIGGSFYIAQVDLEIENFCLNLSTVGITGMYHYAQLAGHFLTFLLLLSLLRKAEGLATLLIDEI
jgi:hypothetical protein